MYIHSKICKNRHILEFQARQRRAIKWSQRGRPKWSWGGPKWSQGGPNMEPRCSKRSTGETPGTQIRDTSPKRTPRVPQNGQSTKEVAKGSPPAPKKHHKNKLFRTKELSSAPIKIRALYNEHSTILSAGPGELVASLVRIFVLKNDASEYTKNVFGATKKCRAPPIKKK